MSACFECLFGFFCLITPYNSRSDIAPLALGLIFNRIGQGLKSYKEGSSFLSGESLIEIDIASLFVYIFSVNLI